MNGEMIRGRSQVIWRYTPKVVFRYNDYRGWCKVENVTVQNISDLKGVLIEALSERLNYWGAIGIGGYPDPITKANKYIVGEPWAVSYELWPTVFICSICKRMHWWSSIERLKQMNDNLRCRSCGTHSFILKQIPYVYICECGKIETLYVPKCPKNSRHSIGLVDKKSFQDSYWYCQECNMAIQRDTKSGLGIRQCQCGKVMRGTTLLDPRVYYSQTLALVDIQPDRLKTWLNNSNFKTLLLGASLQIPNFNASDLQNLSKHKSDTSDLSIKLSKIKNLLNEKGLLKNGADEIDDIISESLTDDIADPWNKYESDLLPIRKYLNGYDFEKSRQTIEFIFVKYEPSTIYIPIDDLIGEAKATNNVPYYSQLMNDKKLGESLGLRNMAVIQELPILLAGFGYTRYFDSPFDFDGSINKAALKPYNEDEDGKIPIYIAKNTTEAFMFELDPFRLTVFLDINKIASPPKELLSSESFIRAWLMNISSKLYNEGESHISLLPFEIERGGDVDLPSAIIFGVLHTISHTLKYTAHQYVGIDKDAIAEYLFTFHNAGILYASSNVEFTLGGIDAVFRSNLSQWLGSVRDFANCCSFDPVCSESGGACMACLYTKFGCNYFNRTLSRAYLYGGFIKELDRNIIGFWANEVSDRTNKLKDSLK